MPTALMYQQKLREADHERNIPFYSEAQLKTAPESFRLGVASFEKGDFGEALEVFSSILRGEEVGGIAEIVSFFIADCYFQMADQKDETLLKKSLDAYERANQNFPQSLNAERGLYRISNIYMDLGFYFEALGTFRRLIDRFPASQYVIKAQMGYAKAVYLQENYLEAFKLFQSVIDAYPKSQEGKEAFFWKANSLYHIKRYREAQRVYEAGMLLEGSDPKGDPEVLFRMGQTYLQNGHFEKARIAFISLLNIYSQDTRAGLGLIQLGKGFQKDRNEKMAKGVFSEAQSFAFNDDISTLGTVALVILEIKAYQAREKISIFSKNPFKDAVLISKGIMKRSQISVLVQEGLLDLGEAFLEAKKNKEAVNLFEAFSKTYFNSPFFDRSTQGLQIALWGHLEELYRQSDYMGVTAYFQEKKPLFLKGGLTPKRVLKVADSFRREGFYPDAIPLYEAIQDDLLAQDLFLLATIYFDWSQDEKGIETMEMLLKKYSRGAVRWKGLRVLGDYFFQAGFPRKALGVYQEWLHQFPRHSLSNTIRFRLSQAHQRVGDNQKAVLHFQVLIDSLNKMKEKDFSLLSQALLGKWDSLYQMGGYRKALTAYQEGIQADLNSEDMDWARYQIGNCMIRLKLYQKARAVFAELSETSQEGLIKEITSEKIKRIPLNQ